MSAPAGLAILIGAGPVAGAGIARTLASPSQGNLAVALLSRTADPKLASSIASTCHGGPGILRAFHSDTTESKLGSAFDDIKKWKTELDERYNTELKLVVSVYNIKSSYKSAFEDETAARFTESLNVYVTGAMVFSQLSLKWMLSQYSSSSTSTTSDGAEEVLQKKGTIIFTSTLGSLRTNPGFAAYGAARASVRMLAQSLAREFSARGIHVVHAIANGAITDKFDKYVSTSASDESKEGKEGEVKTEAGKGEDAAKVLKGEKMKAESIGKLYLSMVKQECDLWTHELDMRPAAEKF